MRPSMSVLLRRVDAAAVLAVEPFARPTPSFDARRVVLVSRLPPTTIGRAGQPLLLPPSAPPLPLSD